MNGRLLAVHGASEHNLADVDVTFGPGLTAVVGVSGSGKSSLVFDTVYAEARRRLMETLALGSPWTRVAPARVRSIDGLGPAVAVAQNVVNHNPRSTVASAVGLHPFLRILYARFAEVSCPGCGTPVRAVAEEERLRIVLEHAESADTDVEVALVRGASGSHERLLSALRTSFEQIVVDGTSWRGEVLDPALDHDITVRVATLAKGCTASAARDVLERADSLGATDVLVGGQVVLRAPVCPGCGDWVPPLEPAAFALGAPAPASHRVAGRSLDELLARPVAEVASFVDDLPPAGPQQRLREELRRRLAPLLDIGLHYLTLDRPMPTLSRGEAQRTRLAVVLAGRLEDLLHVLDEPTIGLHRRDVEHLLRSIASLPGPVVMVEHDVTAIALADDVVEIGPAAGGAGGRVVFQGPPARLAEAGTASARVLAGERAVNRTRRPPGPSVLRVVGAHARNLKGIDCEIPCGLLTAVTGPSGAGKTTLVRDVLLESLRTGSPVGCTAIEAPRLRTIEVDQSPLGNNPRSNPATYTKVFDRVRAVFAAATGRPASEFTFNKSAGACEQCDGIGAIEVKLPFVAPTWISCEACAGSRFRPESLAARWEGRTIAEVLDCSVDQAREMFGGERAITRVLDCLREVGLGYMKLGQPSPTLSGGEAQRVRLARELARAKDGDLVVLDEPTTGLHPADLERLVAVLDRLTGNGCTVVVVEHQPDVVACADWVVELGPGGGPDGGTLLYSAPPRPFEGPPARLRAEPRPARPTSDAIRVRGARAHNLRGVDVEFPKGKLTLVTGVSGSGKSSLVNDVLGAEATRRLLECLSLYERQSAHEGPEAPVRSLSGLGPTLVLDTARRPWGPRATVGSATELDRLVSLVLSRAGDRTCLRCGGRARPTSPAADVPWRCDDCGEDAVPVEARHLMASAANALCRRCSGLGYRRRLVESRLIRRPEEPVCGRCLHSPGYYPRNYLCTPETGGNGSLTAFAERYGFDPYTTPWEEMSPEARQAFLYGDPVPFPVSVRDGKRVATIPGSVRGDRWYWRGCVELGSDIGGLYSEAVPCPDCGGKRLRPEYLAVRLGGLDRADLFTMPIARLETVLGAPRGSDPVAERACTTALGRIRFLRLAGLGYVDLDRPTWSLSAGEAQRVKLAAVVGSGLVGITILLDEPSRGLHPSEVAALAETLQELRADGNTVIAVDHDPVLIRAADTIVEIGPGAGRRGGRLVPLESQESVTRPLLDAGGGPARGPCTRRPPNGWMRVAGARENNLAGEDVDIPLGVLVGVCGVSGSGKSSLVVDTIGLALAPPRTTTGVAWRERVEPGAHERIEGAPKRTIVADQSRSAIVSAGSYLGLLDALREAYADTDDAVAAGLAAADLSHGCDACSGRGSWQERMWFLPAVSGACEACGGSGYRREAAALVARGRTLPEVESGTIEELAALWHDIPAVARTCDAAMRLGLGYLVVRQPGWALSGGEVQRLRLSRELAKRATSPTLYLLDEPTMGLHVSDVAVLRGALDEVVSAGHTVLVVEHDVNLLAACDWLIELGPGGGPDGGRVVFAGTPEALAAASTPTSAYLAEVLA